jgi:hypothetical protein
MFHVGHAGCFDAKVINKKAEGDVTSHVMPQPRCVLALIVASDGKAFFDEFICKDAGLGYTVHALSNFNTYPSVDVNNVGEPILVDNFLGKDVQLEAHVFVALNWGIQVEVGEVSAIERCAGSRNSRVESEFCGGEMAVGVLLYQG